MARVRRMRSDESKVQKKVEICLSHGSFGNGFLMKIQKTNIKNITTTVAGAATKKKNNRIYILMMLTRYTKFYPMGLKHNATK